MTGPTKVLVGIDLSRCKRPDLEALGPITESVVRRAVWLARASGAVLTFFTALEEPRQRWHLFGHEHRARARSAVEGLAREALAGLVRLAHDQGARAEAEIVPGTAWVEIVRRAGHGNGGLVMVGTRDRGWLRRTLFGSTAKHLLHSCPCPVWACKPGPGDGPLQVLVGSDCSPESDQALRLALWLTELSGGQVHLFHAVDFPLDHLWSTGLPDRLTEEYHQRLRAESAQALQVQVTRCGGEGKRVSVEVADSTGVAELAILDYLRDHPIDLLVLGTVAREGPEAALLGNPVERLLPEVGCSVVGVKS
jgi:nucleotide-binding universal stress UspA family protein